MSKFNPQQDLHQDTHLIRENSEQNDPFNPVVPAIYQNSLFTFDSWQDIEQAFDNKIDNAIYTRGKNPTVALVEQKLAQLAGGEKAKLLASGMAAVSAAMLHFLKAGDHIITLKNAYGPAISFINDFLIPKMNIEVSYVSGTCLKEIRQATKENTQLIYLESPTSVVFTLQDIAAIADFAKSKNIATALDNTWATPVFQKPLTMGIDLEIHSCSKYLGGHSDIVAGLLIGNEAMINAIHSKEYELIGAKMAPIEAWLLLRSLRTLHLRMARHQESAMQIASFLEQHPKVQHVYYPGLTSNPQHQLAQKQLSGCSGLLSFQLVTQDIEQIKAFFNRLNLFQIGVSWGGHESLVYAPAISGLKEQSPEQFEKMGISLGNIRISIGLEDADDLQRDLDNSLSLIN